jgi:hypothetical protein
MAPDGANTVFVHRARNAFALAYRCAKVMPHTTHFETRGFLVSHTWPIPLVADAQNGCGIPLAPMQCWATPLLKTLWWMK